MDTTDRNLMSDNYKVPKNFIGGLLNLQPIPTNLVDIPEYQTLDPKSRECDIYINTTFRHPSRPSTDFIFFVNRSISLYKAAAIINANFFKKGISTI